MMSSAILSFINNTATDNSSTDTGIDGGNTTKSTEVLSVNETFQSHCFKLEFKEFIPWNNPDNIVSFEVEQMTRILHNVVFLPILFLIAFPANIINMVVFYKQGLKERINVCLFSLSLADGLYMLNNMLWYAEQLYLVFTTKEQFGPVLSFFVEYNLVGFHGFIWVSQVISAIIAGERCFCIMQPLRSQTVLRTSTMTAIIVVVNIVILALVFLEMTRFRSHCAYDPISDSIIMTTIPSDFYLRHRQLLDYLDIFVLGGALPGLVIAVVVVTTIITTVKLREASAWRAGTSSSRSVSQRDIALTKMLVTNSAFFIACVIPFVVLRFVFLFMPEVNTGHRQHNFYMMIQWILMIFSFFNSTFNIVIYYTMGSRYRETFWSLFRKTKTKKNPKT